MTKASDTGTPADGAQNQDGRASTSAASLVGDVAGMAQKGFSAAAESGKILREGLQQLAGSYAADGRALFETMSADMSELAAARSPFEFMQLQARFLQRNVETAMSLGAKNGEAFKKLAEEASGPITKHVRAAIDRDNSET